MMSRSRFAPSSALAALMALTLLTSSACSKSSGGTIPDDCASDIDEGELVITEIYGNAPGGDEGNEWLEIYNASGDRLNLRGLQLVRTNDEGESRREHIMGEIVIEPEQYMVLGGVLDRFKYGYVDYAYGPDLGAMSNTAGRLMLACGSDIVDRVDYADLAEGKSHQLSGLISPPSAIDNDDFANFCVGSGQNLFFRDEAGTPGMANEICAPLTQDDCIDGMSQRAVVKAQPGDVEISEVMANPNAEIPGSNCDPPCRVGDDVGEWVELRINANIDLNGIQLGRAEPPGEDEPGPGEIRHTIAAIECLPVSTGDYVVLVRSTDPVENGGIDSPYSLDFGLVNSTDGVFVGLAGAVHDVFTYTSSKAGVATQIDLDGDPCDATEPYGYGDLGTPGEPNGECEAVIDVPDGMCIDSDGVTVRPIKNPRSPGEVRIVEWMPNPDSNPGGSDTTGEWVELLANADGPYDLNGVTIEAGSSATLLSDDCLEIAASGRFLVADSENSEENGGITNVDLERTLSITNTGEQTIDLTVDATTLDSVTYTGSSAGVAIQIAGSGAQCSATVPYGDGDLGTPGAQNDLTCN